MRITDPWEGAESDFKVAMVHYLKNPFTKKRETQKETKYGLYTGEKQLINIRN